MKSVNGFSLLELMIVVSLISILTAIAIPNYSSHLIHANRMEAEKVLLQVASRLEEFALTHQTYEGASLKELGFSTLIAHGSYRLTLQPDEEAFELVATPLTTQAQKDKMCGVLSLNAKNERTPSNSDCWA